MLDGQFETPQGADEGDPATLIDHGHFRLIQEIGANAGADEGRARGERGATNHTDTLSTRSTKNTHTTEQP